MRITDHNNCGQVPVVPFVSGVRGQNVVNLTTSPNEMELTIQQVQVLVPFVIKVRAEYLVAEAHVAVKILIGHHNILGSISATNVWLIMAAIPSDG